MNAHRLHVNATAGLLAAAGVLCAAAGSGRAASALFIVAAYNMFANWLLDNEAGRAAENARKLLADRSVPQVRHYRLPVQKKLRTLGSQTVLLTVCLWALVAIVAWRAGLDLNRTLLIGAAMAAAAVPAGLAAISTAIVHASPKRLAAALHAATRCAQADSAALVLLVLIGLAVLAGWHIPLALTISQLLAVSVLILPLPLIALAWDERFPRHHDGLAKYLAFGAVAAALAYANFLFSFARNGLEPDYVSINNPYYFKAAALALVTMVLCQAINLLLVRANDHESFFTGHLTNNKKLLVAFAASLFIMAIIIYAPGVRSYFGTGPLSLVDWLWAIVAGGIYLGARLLQRHTRKHSRRAVIALHREVAAKS